MKENILFSIVIPVYNAQKSIRRTLLSVLQQTFSDYEVVIVNDGSTDNTAAILDEFSIYEQIKVFHQVNLGVSAARNHALQQCSGDYVLFLDADDWVEEHFLQSFSENLTQHHDRQVDLIVGSLNDERIGRINQYGLISARETPYMLGELERSDIIGYLHNKCYKKQILDDNNLRFMEGISMSEDLLFNLKYFFYVDNFLITNSASYHYEDVVGSLSKCKVNYNELKVRKRHLVELYDQIISKFHDNDLDYFLKGISKRVLALDMQIVTSMYHSSFSSAEIFDEIDEIKRGKYSKGIFALLNRNEKMKYIIMSFNTFTAYYFLYALYRMRAF